MTTCYLPTCDEDVAPGMSVCDAEHDQPSAAPIAPESAIQSAIFDMSHQLRKFPTEIEGSERRASHLRAHAEAHIAALQEAQKQLEEYHTMKAALGVLLGAVKER